MRTCPIDGTEFVPRVPNQKFCQPSCAKSGQLLRVRAWQTEHREYLRAYTADYNRGRRRTSRRGELGVPIREREYGLPAGWIKEQLLRQNAQCAICGREISAVTAHVDHDHATGKVRGLLCRPCNYLLGMSHDDPDHLRRAIAYLEAVP